jgi:hypothetical protein
LLSDLLSLNLPLKSRAIRCPLVGWQHRLLGVRYCVLSQQVLCKRLIEIILQNNNLRSLGIICIEC